MQTNSRNSKRIFASSGSFWGASKPVKQTDQVDDESLLSESPETSEDVEAPRAEELPEVEETRVAEAEPASSTDDDSTADVSAMPQQGTIPELLDTPAAATTPDEESIDSRVDEASEDEPAQGAPEVQDTVADEPVPEKDDGQGGVADEPEEEQDEEPKELAESPAEAPEAEPLAAPEEEQESSELLESPAPGPDEVADDAPAQPSETPDKRPKPARQASAKPQPQPAENSSDAEVAQDKDATPPAQKRKPARKAGEPKKTAAKKTKKKHAAKPSADESAKQDSSASAATEAADEPDDSSAFVRTVRKLWRDHRVPTIVGISVVMLLIVSYIAGGVYFSSHFLPQTTVNGNDASLMSYDDFAKQITQEANGYTTHVAGDGIDLNATGADVALTLDTDVYVKAATSQVPSWLWPFAITSAQDYIVDEGVSLDEDKLSTLLAPAIESINANSTPTTNADIAYDEDLHKFISVSEALGTELDPKLVLDTVATEMQGLNSTIELGDAELVQPEVTEDDPQFKAAIDEAENFPDLKLKLIMGGDTVKTLDNDLVRSWLAVDDDFSITGNVDAIAYYTRGTLSSELDSVSGYRTYTRPDGKTIQIHDGTYGWTIDGSELAKIIAQRIHEQSAKPIDVPCISSAVVYNPGGPDWGNRYIDVDLDEQYARMYDENGDLIWASECVSGGPSEGNDTVTGVFAIEDKVSPMTLIGLDSNGDGEPDYENEVTYWMPFWGGYGLHDATWRYTFGGEEYLYDGSHGCVNLPYSAAEQLYYSVEIGDPVIVHW